jgi:hypothetical protein
MIYDWGYLEYKYQVLKVKLGAIIETDMIYDWGYLEY